MVPVRVVTECFKDHWAFRDIEEEESLSRELLFDELFLDEVEEDEADSIALEDRYCSVPFLMLMGLLYCRSNRKQRAEKFYELVEIQLTESLTKDDPEFREYIPYLYEISYKLMFRLYCRHRDQTPSENGEPARCPEIDFSEYTPTTYDQDERIKASFTKIFVMELFAQKSRMSRQSIQDKFTNQIFNLLQPHHLRAKSYEKYQSSDA